MKLEVCRAASTKRIYIKYRLKEIGLYSNYVGFYYLVNIIDLLQTKNRASSFSKEIYPIVANQFHTKEHTIERNVRYLMNAFWESEEFKRLRINSDRNVLKKCKSFISFMFYSVFKDIMF